MKLREIAALLDGGVVGDDAVEIVRVAKIEEAAAGEITFLANERYRGHVATTGASAILVASSTSEEELRPHLARLSFVRVADPYRAFLRLVDHFFPAPAALPIGIHPSAVVASTAVIEEGAAVGPYAIVGARVRVGSGAAVHAHAVLAEGVTLGEGCLIYPSVVIREGCTLGARVVVHSGTVIGSDGFGFAPTPDGTYEKIPQRGIVEIGDDVEIGANCTIDRATIGATRIGRGVKIDNLVQIGHNVVIGDHTVIAGQAGISGSTKIGKHCVIAGQVGFAGHLTIADRTTAGAKSGFSKSITTPGQTWFGYPAKEAGRSFRIEASLRQLPELLGEIRLLEERIRELERKLHPRQES